MQIYERKGKVMKMNGMTKCVREDPKKLGKGGKMQKKGLSPKQKKLPPALQAAILKKQKG